MRLFENAEDRKKTSRKQLTLSVDKWGIEKLIQI